MIRYRVGAVPAVALALLAVFVAGTGQAATAAAAVLTVWVSHETNGGPSGYVTPIDTATNTAGVHIRVGPAPRNMAAAIDGKTVYALVVGSVPLSPGSLIPISTAAHTVGKPIKVGGDPSADAITLDGKTIYLVDEASVTVTPVTVATGTAGKPIKVGFDPYELAITPDGKTIYVVNLPGTVTPISTATNTAGKPIMVSSLKEYQNNALAVTPDGKALYAAGFLVTPELTDPGYLIPVTTATGATRKAIKVANRPVATAVTPDGATAYVVCQGIDGVAPGGVVPLDTAAATADQTIDGGGFLTDILLAP